MMSAWALAVCLTVSAPAPAFAGTDTCMGMEWEPILAVDPTTPTIIAVASIRNFQVDPALKASFDGGSSFTQTITPPALPGHLTTGDPVLAFVTQVNP